MQQDNNIENKLRQLDDEQQPDLGNMDAHWQQMQAMLQPVAIPVKKGLPKWMLNTLSVTAVVILVSAAFFYLTKAKKVNDTAAVPVKESPAEKSTPATTIVNSSDSAEPAMVVTTAVPDIQYHDQGNGNTDDYPDDSSSIFDSMKINFIPCDACPSKKTDSGIVASVNRKMMLDNLFTQLQKEEQHFIIDNSRDTLLQGDEGTYLFIPKNSFNGTSGIQISIIEYYKKSDIVLNQLTTSSFKDQLVSGGMLNIKATYKGNEISIGNGKPLTLLVPDTSNLMKGMALFNGEDRLISLPNSAANYSYERENENQKSTAKYVNWIPQAQSFIKRRVMTEARVLNVIDQPFRVKETNRGQIGYFIISDSIAIEKNKLKQILKEKYGYYKIKLRSDVKNRFKVSNDDRAFDREYAERIGDSIWMDKIIADKYRLNFVSTRNVVVEENLPGIFDTTAYLRGRIVKENLLDFLFVKSRIVEDVSGNFKNIMSDIEYKYSVKIDKLGWINCDRFYTDSRKKINYNVDLGDAATNYYTMLVFNNINSMMTGSISGNKVMFQNIPVGEPVKIISIGINKNGETVYSVTDRIISNQELTGLQFESVSAPDLKAALSKMDK